MKIFDANVIEENSIVTSAEPTLACLVRVCHEMSIPKFKQNAIKRNVCGFILNRDEQSEFLRILKTGKIREFLYEF